MARHSRRSPGRGAGSERIALRGRLAREVVLAFEHLRVVLDFAAFSHEPGPYPARACSETALASRAPWPRVWICAGGTATRLAELTRVTNKHLLPVGRWPMVYYLLQLLQRVGVREVLLVTGQQHAGDFIDLLGDGRLQARSGDEQLLDLDLTYKVQVEVGGIAQVVGMARDFARGEPLVVCLGDNIFEYAQADALAGWGVDGGAMVFVKDVPDPENFGVVAYDGDGSVADIVEKAGVVGQAPPRRRPTTRSWASTPTRPTCSRSSRACPRRAAASSRSRT